jgi:hypothetical protein
LGRSNYLAFDEMVSAAREQRVDRNADPRGWRKRTRIADEQGKVGRVPR